jgi:hypothetical protein
MAIPQDLSADMVSRRIEGDIRRAYRSLSNPEYGFVQQCLDRRPYDGIVSVLNTTFTVEEDTDPNDDVSFGFLVSSKYSRWLLRISMVGPYGVLLRLGPGGEPGPPISGVPESADQLEADICEVIQREGVVLLGQGILEVPIRLKMFTTDPDNVRLYQALFQDTDILPWRYGH